LHSATGFLGRNGLPHNRRVPGKVHPQSQDHVQLTRPYANNGWVILYDFRQTEPTL